MKLLFVYHVCLPFVSISCDTLSTLNTLRHPNITMESPADQAMMEPAPAKFHAKDYKTKRTNWISVPQTINPPRNETLNNFEFGFEHHKPPLSAWAVWRLSWTLGGHRPFMITRIAVTYHEGRFVEVHHDTLFAGQEWDGYNSPQTTTAVNCKMRITI